MPSIEPSSALWIALLVGICIILIYAVYILSKNDIPVHREDGSVSAPAPTPATATVKVKRKAEVPPAPTPFFGIYHYVPKAQTVRCRTCDGENPVNSPVCCICGSQVSM